MIILQIDNNTEFEITKQDIESVDQFGKLIKLENIPTKINKRTKAVTVNLDDILRAEQVYNAQRFGLDPRQSDLLLLIYTDLQYFKGGIIEKTFRLNKMVFLLWQKMIKSGYEKAYIHDDIVGGRAGPIPRHLKELMVDLENKKLVNIKWEKSAGKSSKFELTDEGRNIAQSLWLNIPLEIQENIRQVKETVIFSNSEELKNKIHKEFPEYKRTYIDADNTP